MLAVLSLKRAKLLQVLYPLLLSPIQKLQCVDYFVKLWGFAPAPKPQIYGSSGLFGLSRLSGLFFPISYFLLPISYLPAPRGQ